MSKRFLYYSSQGTPPLIPYVKDYYYDFDIVNDACIADVSVRPLFDDAFSASFYSVCPSHTANDVILSQWGLNASNRKWRIGFFESGGVTKLRLIARDGAPVDDILSVETFTLNQTHHIAISVDVSISRFNVWVDGVLITWASAPTITSFGATTSTQVYFGGIQNFYRIPWDMYFGALWSGAKNDTEMASMFNTTTQIPYNPTGFDNLTALFDSNTVVWNGTDYVGTNVVSENAAFGSVHN